MRYVITASLLCIGLAACTPSPEAKVEQMEKRTEALRESSGYNACMAKIEASDKKIADCITAKIVAAGYTDGLNCIQEYTNPFCKDTTRYNTEVYAGHDCSNQADTQLTMLDCMQMLSEAQ